MYTVICKAHCVALNQFTQKRACKYVILKSIQLMSTLKSLIILQKSIVVTPEEPW